MSSKGKTPKKKSGSYKPKKRKSISPLQNSELSSGTKDSQSGSSEPLSGQWSLYSTSPINEQQKKRVHIAGPKYYEYNPFIDNLNNLSTMSLNFPQMPYGGSINMQSPPPFGAGAQYTGPSMAPNTLPPPSWATEIMEDIKSIKSSMTKIDNIEKMVNKMTVKVDTLEKQVKTIDTRVNDVEKSKEFLSDAYEDTKTKLKSADSDLKKLNNRCKEFEDTVKTLKEKNETLEAKANDLEFRSMRENLLFHGMLESTHEDCEAIIKTFIKEKLDILQDITIDRAHRLGKPRGKTRPIVVKFHQYTDRELIRTTAADKSEHLKTLNQGVGVQQTKAVLQKRRDLSAAYDREKAAGKTVKWAGAKLMVREGDAGNFYEVKE